MPDPIVLIIDDVDAALAQMTAHGQEVVGDCCRRVRDAVREYAARRGWTVVSHNAYMQWVSETLHHDTKEWLILDPLIRTDVLGHRAHSFRLTRRSVGPPGTAHIADALMRICTQGPVGIVDDAAASGITLRTMCDLVRKSGGEVAQILLCASTRSARDSLSVATRTARLQEFAGRQDWRILHLRDGCAYLPFSGRGGAHPSVTLADGAIVDVRFATTSLAASPWRVLFMDSAIRAAILALRAEVPTRIASSLGRQGVVSDLPVLGTWVPAIIEPGRIVESGTPLLQLFPIE